LGAETRAVPAVECYPHCDYSHYYGPLDFNYVRPGLYGYPRCGPRGRDRDTARATLGQGLAVSAFPRSVPV